MDIRDLPAREPGTLAGFETTCPRCGLVLRNSLRTSLVLDAATHEEWEAARDERAVEGRVS